MGEMSVVESAEPAAEVGLRELVGYFLRLGTVGFGGPIALAGRMNEDLVEKRGWITAEEYADGLALAQLAPGPLAAQLAIYLGWLRGRFVGATLVGVAFIAPSFAMVLSLSALYVRFDGLPWMQALFYGIGAAVIAIIGRSAWKLMRSTARSDRLLWAALLLSAAVTAVTETESFAVIVGCGAAVAVARTSPARLRRPALPSLAPLALGLGALGPTEPLGTLFLYFARAGMVVFGSGLAILPFLHGGVVQQFHWLTERQFLDAVAVSMITPGPVVITVAFIGFLVAGTAGASAAAAGVFLPVYLVVALAAPHYHRISRTAWVRHFVAGVTAAATGAIAGAAIVLGRRALVDVPTMLICLATLALLLWKGRKVPEPVLILAAGLAGLVLA